MSSHISDDLPRLLTGDANRDVVMAAAEHLRTCPDCQQELVSAVVAHASLTSAHRFAPEIVASGFADQDEDESGDEPGAPLPDLSTVFAKARDDATVAARHPVRSRRRLVAVAAAAAVIVGGGATFAAMEGQSGPSTRSVALAPFGVGQGHGKIVIDGGKLKIDASALQQLDSKHVYELWLTDGPRAHMQSVGSFSNDKVVELTVAPKVMSQYNDFEVSIQRTNQIHYSGVSVLRGQYG